MYVYIYIYISSENTSWSKTSASRSGDATARLGTPIAMYWQCHRRWRHYHGMY